MGQSVAPLRKDPYASGFEIACQTPVWFGAQLPVIRPSLRRKPHDGAAEALRMDRSRVHERGKETIRQIFRLDVPRSAQPQHGWSESAMPEPGMGTDFGQGGQTSAKGDRLRPRGTDFGQGGQTSAKGDRLPPGAARTPPIRRPVRMDLSRSPVPDRQRPARRVCWTDSPGIPRPAPILILSQKKQPSAVERDFSTIS
jgi:hypothetical protein